MTDRRHLLQPIRIALVGALTAAFSLADVSYQQTIKYTGGSMVEMVRRMSNSPMVGRRGGGFGGAFKDQSYTIYIKGSKMARVSPTSSTIIDLDAGTITNINNERQTYITQTFDELRQRMEEVQQRMGQSAGDVQFDKKVDKTGQTRTVDEQTANEVMMTLTAKQGSANSQMSVTTDAWVVPVTPISGEVIAFYRRLSEKFAYALGAGPGMGGMGTAMTAAMKAALQLDGYPILETTSITGITSPMMGSKADPNQPAMQTETHTFNFASGSVEDSRFTVPAGYTQEQPRMGAGPQ